MGKRFFATQYVLGKYSTERARHRLHKADFEPHRMKPYGLASGNFSYHQMFQKNISTGKEIGQ